MSKVIDLNKRREQKDGGPILMRCVDCKGEEFLITNQGVVICVRCQEPIDDLQAHKVD